METSDDDDDDDAGSSCSDSDGSSGDDAAASYAHIPTHRGSKPSPYGQHGGRHDEVCSYVACYRRALVMA